MSKALKSEKGKLYAVTCDVTQEAQVKQAFQWVKDNLGGVDILVNSAAVLGPDSILGTVSHMCLANIVPGFETGSSVPNQVGNYSRNIEAEKKTKIV